MRDVGVLAWRMQRLVDVAADVASRPDRGPYELGLMTVLAEELRRLSVRQRAAVEGSFGPGCAGGTIAW